MREAWAGAMGGVEYPNIMGKIFLGRARVDGREALLLGQLYPPTVGLVGLEEVEALHGVVGAEGGNIKLCARDEDLDAFKLVAGFRGQATEPINPEWRPPVSPVSLGMDAA